MAMCLTPFIGFLIDRIGHRTLFLIGSSLIMVISHLLILIFPQCPDGSCTPFYFIFPLILMGFFYCVYAACLWPSIPLILPKKIVGTGFGMATAI